PSVDGVRTSKSAIATSECLYFSRATNETLTSMEMSTRATVTAAGATAVAGSAYFGTRYLALAVLVCIVLAGIGWPLLLRVSRPMVSTAIVLGGGTLALIAVVLGRSEPYLRYMVVAIAGMVIA